MSQNLKKALIEHRKTRQVQQRANKLTQKLQALYRNIRPGAPLPRIRNILPQNPGLSHLQTSHMHRPTLLFQSPTITNRKRKNIEQEPTITPATHHLNIPNATPHTDPHEHAAKLDKADNPVPSQISNQKKSKTEDGTYPNKLEQNRMQLKSSDSEIFNKQKGRKVRLARDNQTPGPSKTHTKEELQEIRQALDNFNPTQTNKHTSLNIFTEFEDIRTLPKGKQPIRGPPKGKNSESAAISQGSNTPSTLYQSHSNQQNKNTTKRKCLDCQPNKQNKKGKINKEPKQDYPNHSQNDIPLNQQHTITATQTKTKFIPADYHPRYLTLYLHYPVTPNKPLSDPTIIEELQKHKKGNIQIKHPKPSETGIRCYTGAQIRAYKKITEINDTPIRLCSQHKYITLNRKSTPCTPPNPVRTQKYIPKTVTKGTNLTIWQWNCRGIYQNQLELQAAILETSEKPLVICLQETSLPRKKSVPPNIRNYQQKYQKQRKNGCKRGGLAIYLHDSITQSQEIEITETENDPCEIMAITIKIGTQNFEIYNIYIPPLQTQIPTESLQSIIKNIKQNGILCGDFNAHHPFWGSNTTNTRGKQIYQLIDNTEMVILNDCSPTRMDPHTGKMSVRDLTIITPKLRHDTQWRVLHHSTWGSDHFPIQININTKQAPETDTPKLTWNLKKANWELYQNYLKGTSLEEIRNPDINTFYKNVIEKLHIAADSSIPKLNRQPKQFNLPWWTEECNTAIKAKKKALNKYQNNKTGEAFIEYKKLKAITTRTLKNAREKSWRQFCSKLNHRTNSKIIWNKIRAIKGKRNKQKQIKVIPKPNQTQADTLATHFANASSNANHKENFLQHKSKLETNHPHLFKDLSAQDTCNQDPLNDPFSLTEWHLSLKNKKQTAPGDDSLGYTMYQKLPTNMIQISLSLINQIWNTGILPTTWKQALVVPILKEDKKPLLAESYRPIFLTITLCKIMETMIVNRLKHHLECNNLLTENQSGFRGSRTTLDQILRLETDIKLALNSQRKNNRHLIAIFLDFEKAFDLVWTKGLISKLNKFGIKGRLHRWIENFLSNRTFKVQVGKDTSQPQDLDNGTPQGSVISPILFNLMVNDLANDIHTLVDISQFADDSCIWKAGNPNNVKYIKQLQTSLNHIENWTINWGFKISMIKTVAILFGHPKRHKIEPPTLYLNNLPIQFVNHTVFLGATFDRYLTWKIHINKLVDQCNKDLAILRHLRGLKWGADQDTLLTLYRSLIRSKLDYACQAYDTASKTLLRKLDSIQYKALKLCTGTLNYTSLAELQTLTAEPPLKLRRTEMILKYAARVSTLPDHNPIKKAFFKSSQTLSPNKVKYPPAFTKVHKILKHNQLTIQAEKRVYHDPTPWKNQTPLINFELRQLGSKKQNPWKLLTHIQHLLSTQYSAHTHIYTDSSKQGSKQSASNITTAAFVIPSQQITNKTRITNGTSIFSAELWAINQAIYWTHTQLNTKFLIITDSLSALLALNSTKPTARINLKEDTLYQIRLLNSNNKTIEFLWVPSHIQLLGNNKADQAANEALALDTITEIGYCTREIYSQINKLIIKLWQSEWDTVASHTQLHHIQPKIDRHMKWKSLPNSQHNHLINRIRTGKTKLHDSH
ncbi:hypothetical protein CHS0354_041577 [Potamilus streckersoni]|uniref:Reverse transcriptase domain-containing protein n=1 Tax=Potamilus streckersoni TaxID=2493646 RepID=A0AAE0WCF9_9BIVA|nr:hypothetical protein CHS0354_041577 [Potamilus streckersoni]